MKNIFSFLLLTAVLLIFSCRSKQADPAATEASAPASNLIEVTPEQIAAGHLQLGHLQEYRFSRVVRATGYVDALPQNRRIISAWFGGIVTGLNLLPGQYVQAGQPLFSLENPDFLQMQEEFLSSSEQLAYLENDYQRQQELASEQAASLKTLLKAKSDYLSMAARVEALRQKLEMLHVSFDDLKNGKMVRSVAVKAPFSGYISTIGVSNGKYVSEAEEILEIINPHPMLVRLKVFEKDIQQVKEGQAIHFRVPDAADSLFQATVQQVGKILEGNQRTVGITGSLQNGGKTGLVAGMFVEAGIDVEPFTALALPREAVVTTENRSVVLVRTAEAGKNWKLVQKPVVLGFSTEEMVEILPESGIRPDDWILIRGAFNLVTEE